MKRLVLVLLPLLLGVAWAQMQEAPLKSIPGRPWTSIIPDPDAFDFTNTNRPGYRFRGMDTLHKRFYDYIQAKRRAGTPLSSAEQATIRSLTMIRRWPEAPRPNAFWRAFMRYMRNLQTTELNTAQSLMLAELNFRGLCVFDAESSGEVRNLVEFLRSRKFEPQNWFERNFIHGPTWMKQYLAACSYDMRASDAAPGNVFPADKFNGMQITYDVSGATLGKVTDSPGFTTGRDIEGFIHPGALSVSCTVSVGGYGADVTVRVWAGSEKKEKTEYIENKAGATGNFALSVPVAPGTKSGGFSIRMDGRYSMGGGHRGLYVAANLTQTPAEQAAEQAAADAEWRKQVEDTLKALGYEETKEGTELNEMRKALQGGDAAWKKYVDNKLKQLGYDAPDAQQYSELKEALEEGGTDWAKYATDHGGGASLPNPDPAAQDTGGLRVGTGLQGDQLQNPAQHFDSTGEVATSLEYKDLPANSVLTVVWTRDGQEISRRDQTTGGTGSSYFRMMSSNPGGLKPGDYQVTITRGDQIMGRKFFTIGVMGNLEQTPWGDRLGPTQVAHATAATPPGPTTSTPAPTDSTTRPPSSTDPKTYTVTGGASSARSSLQVSPAGGCILLKLRRQGPGTILDTVGINAATPGDCALILTGDNTLSWLIYHPDIAGPRRQPNGWHMLTSNLRLQAGVSYNVAVTYGPGGMRLSVDGRVLNGCPTALTLSGKPIWVGDFPGDDGWGTKYNIHPAFKGEVRDLAFTPDGEG